MRVPKGMTRGLPYSGTHGSSRGSRAQFGSVDTEEFLCGGGDTDEFLHDDEYARRPSTETMTASRETDYDGEYANTQELLREQLRERN